PTSGARLTRRARGSRSRIIRSAGCASRSRRPATRAAAPRGPSRGGGAGAAPAAPGPVRRRVVEQLSRALPPAHPRGALRAAAVVLGVAALAWAAFFGPRAGEGADRRRARGAR